MTKPGLFRVSHDINMDVFALDTEVTEARVPVLSAGVLGGVLPIRTSGAQTSQSRRKVQSSPVLVQRESSSATVERSLVVPARRWSEFSIVGLENKYEDDSDLATTTQSEFTLNFRMRRDPHSWRCSFARHSVSEVKTGK
jgi:hypothetical protein